MFDKDKILFSLVGLIGDDMPYVISELDQKTQTVNKDSPFTCTTAILANMAHGYWSIEYPDGSTIHNSSTTFTDENITCFFPEGTKFTLVNPISSSGLLFYFPLRKLGGVGGIKSYCCLLKAQPKVLFFVTGE